jgi:hypothetical protein
VESYEILFIHLSPICTQKLKSTLTNDIPIKPSWRSFSAKPKELTQHGKIFHMSFKVSSSSKHPHNPSPSFIISLDHLYQSSNPSNRDSQIVSNIPS